MAFKMNKAAFNFGKGTGSSRLTKTPLYKSPPMGSEGPTLDELDEIAKKRFTGEPKADMDAVVVTPKMEEKRDKKNKREKKRKDKRLARIKKKEMKIRHDGKDSDEYKKASEELEALKTGKQKVKAKVKKVKSDIVAKVDDIKTNVKDTVGKVKKKYTKSDEEKELKQKQNLAKLKRKNPEKYKALEDASKMAASSFTKNPSAAIAMGAGKKMKK
jgi:hypothetical protein